MSKTATRKAFIQYIVDSFDIFGVSDSNHDALSYVAENLGNLLDTSGLDADKVMALPRVKKAFFDFIVGAIGGLQQLEEEAADSPPVGPTSSERLFEDVKRAVEAYQFDNANPTKNRKVTALFIKQVVRDTACGDITPVQAQAVLGQLVKYFCGEWTPVHLVG